LDKKFRYFIGIDPDVEKSGFAIWDKKESEFITYLALAFWELINLLTLNSELIDTKVIIEAGWLNKKSNFHGGPNQKKHVGELIAKKVGANHQVGKLLVEYCEYHKIPYEVVCPKTKKTTAAMFKMIIGLNIKNQDVIDACMLVYGL